MYVHVVYRQRVSTGWFGRKRLSPKEVAAVYADEDTAQDLVDAVNSYSEFSHYSTEPQGVLYGHRLLKQELLGLLTENGKALLGL